MKPAETMLLYQVFLRKVEALKGDALLDEKIAFDELGPAAEGERDLRLLQSECLEMALIQQYGIGAWQAPLEGRKEARRGQPEEPI
jgi:hypothetical protein